MGRQVCGVVGRAVRQVDWGMELVEDHGVRGQHKEHHGLRGQHKEHRLPNQVFIVEYRIVNPMTIHVFSSAVRVTVVILASPPTGLLLQYCTL